MPELMQTTTSGADSRAEPATHAAAPPASRSECSVPRTARSRGGGGGGGPMLGCPTSPSPSEVEAPLAHLRAAQNEIEPLLPRRPLQPADGLREEAASRELSLHSLASAHHQDKHAPVGAAAAAAGRVGPGALGQLAHPKRKRRRHRPPHALQRQAPGGRRHAAQQRRHVFPARYPQPRRRYRRFGGFAVRPEPPPPVAPCRCLWS